MWFYYLKKNRSEKLFMLVVNENVLYAQSYVKKSNFFSAVEVQQRMSSRDHGEVWTTN